MNVGKWSFHAGFRHDMKGYWNGYPHTPQLVYVSGGAVWYGYITAITVGPLWILIGHASWKVSI